TRTYDGTAVASAGILTIDNNLDGANLTLTGTGSLSSKAVGSRSISAAGPATVTQVASATGASPNGTVTSLAVTVAAPANGNTMIAVISVRASALNQVTSISQTGATWSRASQAANSSGTTTEIWYASNV